MATYKLMQDIEADDHILGPLSFRQFVFALVAAFFFYLCFLVATNGVAFLLVITAPPALFFAFFAFPFGRDQPTEVWFLAKLRFWFLPRQRIWNQSGVKELVTITVPKKVERVLTDGLSQTEVKSRLHALADTIDSRGWVTKNVGFNQPIMAGGNQDRLINIDNMPQEVPADEPLAANDFFDTANNPVAQQFDTMITQSAQAHHQELVDKFNAPVAPVTPQAPVPVNNWFIGQTATPSASYATPPTTYAAPPAIYAQAPVAPVAPPAYAAPTASGIQPVDTADETAILMQLKQKAIPSHAAYGHMRTMQPLGSQLPVAPPPPPVEPPQISTSVPVTAPSDPAILALANNNDLNVATLARQAQKAKERVDQSQNEVVISLR